MSRCWVVRRTRHVKSGRPTHASQNVGHAPAAPAKHTHGKERTTPHHAPRHLPRCPSAQRSFRRRACHAKSCLKRKRRNNRPPRTNRLGSDASASHPSLSLAVVGLLMKSYPERYFPARARPPQVRMIEQHAGIEYGDGHATAALGDVPGALRADSADLRAGEIHCPVASGSFEVACAYTGRSGTAYSTSLSACSRATICAADSVPACGETLSTWMPPPSARAAFTTSCWREARALMRTVSVAAVADSPLVAACAARRDALPELHDYLLHLALLCRRPVACRVVLGGQGMQRREPRRPPPARGRQCAPS